MQKSTQSKGAQSKKELLGKAVAELMHFRKMQKLERERLAKLKEKTAAEAKVLAALTKARNQAVKAQISEKQKKELAKRSKVKKDFGSYHALVIGIDKYRNLPPLRTAVADAIAQILKKDYGFKVKKLTNPSRDDILDSLDDFRSLLTFNDNLLIYYSGHGALDKKADEGYWLPVNAKSNRRSRWLSNNTLTAALRAFEAKHVMVVADSCYSSRLTRGISVRPRLSRSIDYMRKIAKKRARVVLTSGGLQPVDDGKGGAHSPFADSLLKALNENTGIFDGASLYKSVHRPTMLKTKDQEPQYSDVRQAGHDGGDFIFVKNDAKAK